MKRWIPLLVVLVSACGASESPPPRPQMIPRLVECSDAGVDDYGYIRCLP